MTLILLPRSGDWNAPLAFLSERCIPGIERPGPPYQRVARCADQLGHVSIHVQPGQAEVTTTGLPPEFVDAKARRLLGIRTPTEGALTHLRADPFLTPALEEGLPRLPGAWDGFEVAVRAVLGQQVTVKAARTFAKRLAERLGSPFSDGPEGLERAFPTPLQIAEGNLDGLGLTGRRIDTLQNIGRLVAAGELDFDGAVPLAGFVEALVALPGIGPWTAHYIALRAFAAEDAFPPADAGLLRAYKALGGQGGARALDKAAERWRPFRGYACMALWRYDSRIA